MEQELQLIAFLDAFEKKNKKLNLVSYKTREELEIKHLQDSLSLLEIFDLEDGQRVLDIGAGGGFPGLPLAIMAPEAELVLMDSTEKKMKAVANMASDLGVKNLETVTGRFEELGHDDKYREAYGMVVARAVAPLPTLLEFAASFVCVHGFFVAYKSADYHEELKDSINAQKELGLEFEGPIDYELHDDMGKRCLLIFRKTEPLDDQYPRRDGVPKKKPL
jgi:16S rRNA (guanine527-N7)-methyltransferase